MLVKTKNRTGLSVIDNQALLYQTKIVKVIDNVLILNSGGWKGKHTKTCINDLIRPLGFHLYQRDFQWYVLTPELKEVEFTDNIELELTA